MIESGKPVEVEHSPSQLNEDEQGTAIADPPETAFSELVEKPTDAPEPPINQLVWLEGGAFTDEPNQQLVFLCEREIVRVDEQNFFVSDGS
jgi:hypothetical protein